MTNQEQQALFDRLLEKYPNDWTRSSHDLGLLIDDGLLVVAMGADSLNVTLHIKDWYWLLATI